MAESMTQPGQWYAVQTKSRSEWIATERLTNDGWTVFFPKCRIPWSHARKHTEVTRPFLPGYIFAGVAEGLSVYALVNTIGVSSLVGFNGAPARIPTSDPNMAALLSRCDPQGYIDQPEQPLYHYGPGDTVMPDRKSPYWPHPVEIENVDNPQMVTVWMQIFGARRIVPMPHEHIGEIIERSPKRRRIG